jgi:hypothetical protein
MINSSVKPIQPSNFMDSRVIHRYEDKIKQQQTPLPEQPQVDSLQKKTVKKKKNDDDDDEDDCNKNSGHLLKWIVIGIVAALLIGAVFYFFYIKKKQLATTQQSAATATQQQQQQNPSDEKKDIKSISNALNDSMPSIKKNGNIAQEEIEKILGEKFKNYNSVFSAFNTKIETIHSNTEKQFALLQQQLLTMTQQNKQLVEMINSQKKPTESPLPKEEESK